MTEATFTESRQQRVTGGSDLRLARLRRRSATYRSAFVLTLLLGVGHACGVIRPTGFTSTADVPMERSMEILGDINASQTQRAASAVMLYQRAVHAIDALHAASADPYATDVANDSKMLLDRLLAKLRETEK